MFSSALKSISATNITGNYSISPNPISAAGPWKIYDAKKKSTGKQCSVFVFDRKSLESHGNALGRSGNQSFKRSIEEVVDRLKKEASSLAKLRHPSVLELVEPVEETRGGGLQFVTEAVTASLASLLQDKDDQERSGGKSSRYVTEDADGTRRRRELEIDELEIQKGLLQVSKALEFLHENAGLVHGNLTPDAILVNAKSDWKISGLAFCSPADGSSKPTSIQGVSLSEVLNLDPRLPKHVQLSFDYTSPDFIMDHNMNSSADMFSLGLLCVALYNSPHTSPLESNGSVSTYKRLFTSSSTVPSSSNNFLSSRPLPKDLTNHVLPRLITRRPAQRMTAREFQQSEFFDNILVSTIRFLDSFPAKTANEKAQFMRGLLKVLPSFPKSVMERKLLPALLDELKDRELLSLILQNVFKMVGLLPSARRSFGEKVLPALKVMFITNAKQTHEKDPARDAGLMIVLDNLSVAAENCSGKEFKDDLLPIIMAAIESPTHSIVDAAMKSLPAILPILDFSTIKNELFPVVASVFSKTNSLAIKVRGLHAFAVLCGASGDASGDDGMNGLAPKKKTSSSSALDKYTMQEKIVPLIRVIKTKEPAVMMAGLRVLRIVGEVADADFVAMDILPILWSMSLGPLLDLQQFQLFMDLIRSLSKRVEEEQTRKLQELSGNSSAPTAGGSDDFLSFGGLSGSPFDSQPNGATADDFEALVKGRSGVSPAQSGNTSSWDAMPSVASQSSGQKPSNTSASTPAFSWSSPSATPTPANRPNVIKPQQPNFRTVTPDLAGFGALTPASTQFSQPLQASQPPAQQHTQSLSQPAQQVQQQQQPSSSINWGAAAHNQQQSWTANNSTSLASPTRPTYSSNLSATNSSMSNMSLQQASSSFSLPPPPPGPSSSNTISSFGSIPPPPSTTQQPIQWGQTNLGSAGMNRNQNGGSIGGMTGGMNHHPQQPQPKQKSGLDKYESLI